MVTASSFLVATGLSVFLLLNGAQAVPSPASGDKSKAASIPGWSQLKYFFVFGDSYSQTGFNLTDGQPLPAVGNPLGNPPYPGFTSSDGPNWIDYLTTEFNKSLVLTYNMAFGGATIDSNLVTPFEPTVLSIKDQVEKLFLPNLAKETFWSSSDSLFFIWDGVNDVGDTYSRGDRDTFYDTLMNAYFALVNELYEAGARNFLFMDVPPVDRTPGTTQFGSSASAQEKAGVALYNSKLAAKTQQLLANHSDATALVFSTNTVFTNILNNPSEFGIKNTTAFCTEYENGTNSPTTLIASCGIPVNEYMWLNTLHPTWTVHQELAKELANSV